MGQSPFLKIILFVAIGAIVLFPVYTVFIDYPSFARLLNENASREAVRIATILSSILIDEEAELRPDRLPPAFLKHVRELQRDSRIIKLKIFNTAGTVVFSTTPDEIGGTNEADYFRRLVKSGGSKAQEVGKYALSLENQVMPADVVETYVPIMEGNKMIGVFEIYYDITAERTELRKLGRRSAGVLFGLAALLLITVVVSNRKARQLSQERRRIEEDLVESEKRYRALFEHAGDAIFILESEGGRAGQIVATNQAAAAMHGYSIEEMEAMKIMDLDTPESARNSPELFRRVLDGEWVNTELNHRKKDGSVFPVEVSAGPLELGGHKYTLAFDRDITARRQIEAGREKLIAQLQEAIDKIKTLKGMLPICSSCKKIRDDQGYWSQIEEYIRTHTEAEFTHGLCPDCVRKLYPGMNGRNE